MKIRLVPTIIAILIACIFFILIILRVGYAKRIYPNIVVAGINLGGKTRAEAEILLNNRLTEYQKNAQITIIWQKRSWKFNSLDLGVMIDTKQTIEDAYRLGRGSGFWTNSALRLKTTFTSTGTPLSISFDDYKLDQALTDAKKVVETPYQNAQIFVEDDQVIIIPEGAGQKIQLIKLKVAVRKLVNKNKSGEIEVTAGIASPELLKTQLEPARAEAELIIFRPIKLSAKDYKFTLSRSLLGEWIYFAPANVPEELQSAMQFNKYIPLFKEFTREEIHAQLSDKKLSSYAKNIAKEIDIEPQDAKLQFGNSGLSISTPDVKGRSVNQEQLNLDIKSASISDQRNIEIKVEPKLADIRTDNFKSLGIKELIAEGQSNFAGSPDNRKHNIAVGASKFNGALIKSGQEFSFTKTLGKVDETTGYLPELVIKEDETVPEFGGGLCQTSTTFFRAVLLAGLPILERRNHAYRVKYYDWPYGPGVDATIYIPHPDVRVRNDTGNYILIQTSISGNILKYSLYGTKGSRSAIIEKPKILEENPDKSMKTEFYRVVYENNKEVRRDRFYSEYDSPDKYPKPTPEAPETTPQTNQPASR